MLPLGELCCGMQISANFVFLKSVHEISFCLNGLQGVVEKKDFFNQVWLIITIVFTWFSRHEIYTFLPHPKPHWHALQVLQVTILPSPSNHINWHAPEVLPVTFLPSCTKIYGLTQVKMRLTRAGKMKENGTIHL